MQEWVSDIERKGQAIIYGPPGTGKTFLAEKLAQYLVSGSNGKLEILQFHPAYTYDDFILGLRPKPTSDKSFQFDYVPGRFLQLCESARLRSGKSVLIIDEMNRAPLAQVLGELILLLEYREKMIPLANGMKFSVPKNLRIIGTMNTADRSIRLVDHALRRRFASISLRPDFDVLTRYHVRNYTGFDPRGLVKKLRELNEQIGDDDYSVGISYFLRENLKNELPRIWRTEIEPYLEEYFFNEEEKVEKFRWKQIGQSIQNLL